MIKEGYSLESDLCWADVAQYFRECLVCGDDVNDQSENVCDKCDLVGVTGVPPHRHQAKLKSYPQNEKTPSLS
ncbi:hypothetical protein AWH49_14320 [Domibacillus aminovorans]|uniref:Uncharacterized protein n=1 Tax=Domibacillus aminovorans TaxID=29332 RepID=A0A177L6J9_9BACI|nr:hypothetical protein AWH49_14320 [Domibacillus aminovorans]